MQRLNQLIAYFVVIVLQCSTVPFEEVAACTNGGKHRRAGTIASPSLVHWTVQGAVTPVKQQRECGSSWSPSAT